MEINEITRLILEAAYKVHSELGPGLLESSYQACLAYEIRKRGLHVETEVALPLVYEEIKLECGYRIDMLVENKVIIELKVVEALNDVHLAQILTYLKFSHINTGLLINFNVKSLKAGIRRVVR
ncbi:GxxExxY protein [Microbacter margulisiae]|uniref:GxxExxY protein n=1 Tax=Microbacter margulisiae TaxID=1350067 RepID=A0A7W5DQH9_9PORP|nr:GxxExxY protein [Microbacter margulisiae]MBB3187212.1 GxxExxY protein [Microbacter margulisiae]